ncbi:flavodoxin domain-containing protein [Limosilactobacillus fermentum]
MIYATISGHNLELADYLQEQVASWPLAVMTAEAAVAELPTGPLFFCPATYGAGELTDDGDLFLTDLTSSPLNGQPFWVVGIGDQCYGDDFGAAVLHADQVLRAAGGNQLAAPLIIDYELDDLAKDTLKKPLAQIKETLLDKP